MGRLGGIRTPAFPGMMGCTCGRKAPGAAGIRGCSPGDIIMLSAFIISGLSVGRCVPAAAPAVADCPPAWERGAAG